MNGTRVMVDAIAFSPPTELARHTADRPAVGVAPPSNPNTQPSEEA